MSDIRIATRYAKSLIDLAQETNLLEDVTENMRHFTESIENRDLQLLLKSPIINSTKKQNVFDALFGGYQPLTKKFLSIVLSKGRESYLPAIAKEYLNQYRQKMGISQVSITSAKPLPAAAIEGIKSKLIAQGLTTSNIQLEQKVDEDLIGGFILEVGDNYYDASVKHQLNNMRKQFTENTFV